jgi:two-component system response regulator PrrA
MEGLVIVRPLAREVLHMGEPLEMRRKEFQLLELLASNANIVLPYQEIVDEIGLTFTGRNGMLALRVHIRELRRKLPKIGEQGLIQNVFGFGYGIKDLTAANILS